MADGLPPEDAEQAVLQRIFAPAVAFEREWSPRVGGDLSEPIRGVLGSVLALLVQHYKVEPRQLADYVRELLRFTYPETFK